MLSVGLLFLMLFLAFEGAVVQADDEDYDPCKAGKIFLSTFRRHFPFLAFLFFVKRAIFPRVRNTSISVRS